MNHAISFFGCASLAAALLCASPARSQDAAKQPTPEEMMKMWEALGAPGDAHKLLNDFVGEWETTSSMMMGGPGAPPTVTKGTARISWALDGRFLLQEATGEMFGKPMRGMGYTGYNNANKRYEMFWIDNTSTSMYTADGLFDKAGKVLTMYGKMDDPSTGEHGKNIIYVSRKIDADKFAFEFHDPVYEPSTKVGEIMYVRKK